MFEGCQQGGGGGDGGAARCADVAEKLAQLFGWRQTYRVEKLQRSLSNPPLKKKSPTHLIHRNNTSIRKEKTGDSWVVVHSLQSQSDGGILDPDDRLNDVADDREQIIAKFEERDGQHHHGGGDGASGSSVGTGSPDIFQGECHKFQPYSRTDIEVTGEQIASGLIVAPLQVRRGSEPALNQLLPATSNAAGSRISSAAPGVTNGQHWSATPDIDTENSEPKEKRLYRKDGRAGRHTNTYLTPEWYQHNNNNKDEEMKSTSPSRFAREGSNRLSMQFLGEGTGFRWADAAERAAIVSVNTNNRAQSKSLPRDHRRKEPLGQANSTSPTQSHNHIIQDSDIEDELNSDSVEYVVIHNETGPLGIHVVPDYDGLGKDRGLLVQGIEPGGRIDRDGRLAVYDRIIEINGSNLLNIPFQRVQEIFKDSLRSVELQLRVIKHQSPADHFKKPPPPVFPRSLRGEEKENVAMVEGEERLISHKVATVSPTKKASPGHPATRNTNSLLSANTRKIGRKIELDLIKGPHGLGFSITTRDNPAGGNCPIYIKNILTKGAAVEDGRLKPGDRLLEVNAVEMTGKTQSEAVAVLRTALPGSRVRIVVSRQEDSTSPKLPRQISSQSDAQDLSQNSTAMTSSDSLIGDRLIGESKDVIGPRPVRESGEKANDDGLVFPWKHREILTFDIPVHDTEKAGLGVSVKGKTSASPNSSTNTVDLGIFVKSVLHGGAASRDGRLATNDQLLNVNGISLLAQSNSDAMETLRRAMLATEGPIPGVISITIARRANGPRGSDSTANVLNGPTVTENNLGKDETCTPDNSGASENSDTTVIFLPYKNNDDSRDSRDSHKSTDSKMTGGYEMVGPRNPVIDRLTGQMTNQNALRNESYYQATNDTWNNTMKLSGGGMNRLTSPTINMQGPEMVLIEEEYHEPTVAKDEKSTRSVDATYTSQLSLEEAAGFSRDAFGRQSMSEKRHATLDAKHTDTYQRNKKIREERDRYRHNINQQQQLHETDPRLRHEFGPSLGMKKSSSLESLQTMVQEIQMQEDCDPAYTYRNSQGAVRVIRGRGCNESFRAAVDRSYEAPLADVRVRTEMETVAEEDGDVGSLPLSSMPAFANVRGGPRQSSMNAVLDKNKAGKKKAGLFRGIGSMFRFGKHRKTLDTQLGLQGAREDEAEGWDRQNEEREAARKAAQDEQQRIQEQYRRLMLRQKQMQQNEQIVNSNEGFPQSSHHREGSVSSNHATNGLHNGPHNGSHNDPHNGPHNGALNGPHNGLGHYHKGPNSVGSQNGNVLPLINNGIGPTNKSDEPTALVHKSHQRDASTSSATIQIVAHGQKPRDGSNQGQNANSQNYRKDNQQSVTQIRYQGTGPPPANPRGVNNQPSGNHRDENGQLSWNRQGSSSSTSSQISQGVYQREVLGPPPPPHGIQTRTERIHQLRAQHQRRHVERRGQYPMEEREEKYEQVIRQRLEQPEVIKGRVPPPTPYDLYGDLSRPGSRVGITDPQRYSHYVNYEEIQIHLNKRKEQLSDSQILQMRLQVQHQRFKVEEESRRQQHYHSQRGDNREPNQRPVSNFYEYESVQALMRANQQQRVAAAGIINADTNSLPRRTTQQVYQQTNRTANAIEGISNGTTIPGGTRPLIVESVNKRTQGPFVTQVMIGQTQPPGSKV